MINLSTNIPLGMLTVTCCLLIIALVFNVRKTRTLRLKHSQLVSDVQHVLRNTKSVDPLEARLLAASITWGLKYEQALVAYAQFAKSSKVNERPLSDTEQVNNVMYTAFGKP